MFEELHGIYVDRSKHKPILLVNISNIKATLMKEDKYENKEIQLLFSTREVTDAQSSDTFCSTVL